MGLMYALDPLNGLDFTAVVGLAFVLAMGFLLVILSCALWANWLPLLVGEQQSLVKYRCRLQKRADTHDVMGGIRRTR